MFGATLSGLRWPCSAHPHRFCGQLEQHVLMHISPGFYSANEAWHVKEVSRRIDMPCICGATKDAGILRNSWSRDHGSISAALGGRAVAVSWSCSGVNVQRGAETGALVVSLQRAGRRGSFLHGTAGLTIAEVALIGEARLPFTSRRAHVTA